MLFSLRGSSLSPFVLTSGPGRSHRVLPTLPVLNLQSSKGNSSKAKKFNIRSDIRANKRGCGQRLSRKAFNQTITTLIYGAYVLPVEAVDSSFVNDMTSDIRLPIYFYDGAYVCDFSIEGGAKLFGQLDTGSPFLILTNDFYQNQGRRTNLPDTYERYTGEEGLVQWNQGTIRFGPLKTEGNSIPYFESVPDVIFGVFTTYMNNGGDSSIIIGLIKNRADDVRPTFLEKTNVRTLVFDFVQNELLLSSRSLISSREDKISFVDFRYKFNAPVQHYICEIENLLINDQLVRTSKKIYGMIDTGASGVYVSEKVFYELQSQARGWRSMELDVKTSKGNLKSLRASRPDPLFVVLPGKFPWLPPDSILIVIGIVFLQQCKVTLDVDKSTMVLDVPAT